MHKRQFLASAALAATGAAQAQAEKKAAPASQPVLLTVGGAIARSNRGPLDPQLDQMLAKHKVQFAKAFTFDSAALQRLARVSITPTLEYDNKKHKLTGPLLTTVLGEAGADLKAPLRLGLRAVDGYNAIISLADVQAYRMMVATHLDDQPMALGGLGPQWAVYDADNLAAFKDKPVHERFALCPWGVYYIDVATQG
ncbi:molybdopterin-dependent oxidoreductase [Pseudorhodoferax sp.]|uniref:molybdopterin-dependent oxidoreductase n=1 Tax=Pseudorhodoferax sp. TaxID=1993553 RepID=UPI002DD63D20|nr:molybdopterin-dependent oxidoreductase [Pseudorhodoferax sp.]